MYYVDSHCHFNLLEFSQKNDTLQSAIDRAHAANVRAFLNVSVDLKDVPDLLALCDRYPHTYASAGLHPDHVVAIEPTVDDILAMGGHEKVVAIGETGLDYYRITGDTSFQRERFKRHIAAAKILGKPLIIHTRAAAADTLAIMRSENASTVGGVMHCFTENWEIASQALDCGFYISISGIVTFKNAETVQNVATRVPLDRLLIETDAPYLAPVPYRGKPNEPSFLPHTAAFIAQCRGVAPEVIRDATTANFFALFTKAEPLHV